MFGAHDAPPAAVLNTRATPPPGGGCSRRSTAGHLSRLMFGTRGVPLPDHVGCRSVGMTQWKRLTAGSRPHCRCKTLDSKPGCSFGLWVTSSLHA